MTINPKNITDFNRSPEQLQAFWLFCMFVAGKNSDYAATCLAKMLHKSNGKPFEYLRGLGECGIHNALVVSRVGQYGRLTKGIIQSLGLDLVNCTLEDLLAVHGVGPKTARFFLLHSRQDSRHAVLDTHILAWLRENGMKDAPNRTPQNAEEYGRLESYFVTMAKHWFPLLSLAEVDLLIWTKQSGRLD